MVDLQFILYCVIGAAVLAAIALIGSNFSAIVSIVSGQWRVSIERARAQKARRERLYGYGIEPDNIDIEPPVPGSVLYVREAEHTGTSVPVPEIASRADALDILARVRVDGKYLFTGNKLADLFTGTAYAASRNTILDEIAAIRNPEKIAPPHSPSAPMRRPANGW